VDPSCGCEFGDALDGRVGEPGEDGAEVVAHRDEPARAFNLSTTARMAAKSKQATGWVRPLEKWNRSRVPRFGAKAEQGDASLNPDEFVITSPLQLIDGSLSACSRQPIARSSEHAGTRESWITVRKPAGQVCQSVRSRLQ
jgi:hypothetical protein